MFFHVPILFLLRVSLFRQLNPVIGQPFFIESLYIYFLDFKILNK